MLEGMPLGFSVGQKVGQHACLPWPSTSWAAADMSYSMVATTLVQCKRHASTQGWSWIVPWAIQYEASSGPHSCSRHRSVTHSGSFQSQTPAINFPFQEYLKRTVQQKTCTFQPNNQIVLHMASSTIVAWISWLLAMPMPCAYMELFSGPLQYRHSMNFIGGNYSQTPRLPNKQIEAPWGLSSYAGSVCIGSSREKFGNFLHLSPNFPLPSFHSNSHSNLFKIRSRFLFSHNENHNFTRKLGSKVGLLNQNLINMAWKQQHITWKGLRF